MSELGGLRSEVGEVKIQVARVEERLVAMGDRQETVAKNVGTILSKMHLHEKTLSKYKSDRNWVLGLFGVLYAGLIAWLERGHLG